MSLEDEKKDSDMGRGVEAGLSTRIATGVMLYWGYLIKRLDLTSCVKAALQFP